MMTDMYLVSKTIQQCNLRACNQDPLRRNSMIGVFSLARAKAWLCGTVVYAHITKIKIMG